MADLVHRLWLWRFSFDPTCAEIAPLPFDLILNTGRRLACWIKRAKDYISSSGEVLPRLLKSFPISSRNGHSVGCNFLNKTLRASLMAGISFLSSYSMKERLETRVSSPLSLSLSRFRIFMITKGRIINSVKLNFPDILLPRDNVSLQMNFLSEIN